MRDIEHYVFDIGRVLLHWDAELIYTYLIPDAAERAKFLNTVCSPAWNLEQDRGRDWGEAEQVLIDQFPTKEPLIRAFRQNWIKSVPYAYDDVVELYETLIDQGKDVTLLTNFNQETYLEAEARYPFLKRARGVTVSGRVNLLKPDPAIYQHHQEEFYLNPAKTLFLDDSAANVEGARALGWKAERFEGIEGVERLGHIFGG